MLWSRPPPHGSGQTAVAMPAIAIVYRQELNALRPLTFLITVRSMVWTYPLPPAKSGGVLTPMYRYSIHNINVHHAYTWITTNGKVYSLLLCSHCCLHYEWHLPKPSCLGINSMICTKEDIADGPVATYASYHGNIQRLFRVFTWLAAQYIEVPTKPIVRM